MEIVLLEAQKKTFFTILTEGGWTMIPIILLLLLGLFIFFERYLTIRKYNKNPQAFMQSVRSYVTSGNLEQAKTFCMQEDSPFARMILKGVQRLGAPLNEISSAIENVANLELYRLEKRVSILSTIAGAAPMLGFFGTTLGMIQAFMVISDQDGSVSPKLLAGPISEAMVSTAAGLAVGVLAYLGYNLIVNMIRSIIHKMENTSTDFIDLLQEPA